MDVCLHQFPLRWQSERKTDLVTLGKGSLNHNSSKPEACISAYPLPELLQDPSGIPVYLLYNQEYFCVSQAFYVDKQHIHITRYRNGA